MEEKKYLKLNDIEAYKISFQLSNYVWEIVIKWNTLEKDTIGKRLIQFWQTLQKDLADLQREIKYIFKGLHMVHGLMH
jgi:hypothetical protein